MATYRNVHTSFWQDGFVLGLTPEEKYFYLYLMTNSKTTQCGIYELPKRVMELETGYNRETVDKLLHRFILYKKVLYNEDTQEIMLTNWIKHNLPKSEKIVKCIIKELQTIKDRDFKQLLYTLCERFGYPIHTPSIPYGEKEAVEEEKEQEEEEEQEKAEAEDDDYIAIVNKFCDLHGKMDLHMKDKERQDIRLLLQMGINKEFILTTMIRIFNQRTERGERIKSFSYYTEAIIDAWKGANNGRSHQSQIRPSRHQTPELDMSDAELDEIMAAQLRAVQ